jgi:hypothetical protein
MTYGVYAKDLKSVSLSGVSLETARRYKYRGHVVCTEKRRTVGFRLKIGIMWRHWEIRFAPFWQQISFGPLDIRWETVSYIWADEIVGDEA